MRSFKTVVLTMLLLMPIAGCASTNGGGTEQLSGLPVPTFSLNSMDGRKISTSDFRGKVVLLDFWATWCPPCREGLPHLQAMATDPKLLSEGLVVIAINERESSNEIKTFLDRFGYSFPVVKDTDGSVARSYSVTGLPTTVVVGRDGTVRAVISGFTKETEQQIDGAVAQALQQQENR